MQKITYFKNPIRAFWCHFCDSKNQTSGGQKLLSAHQMVINGSLLIREAKYAIINSDVGAVMLTWVAGILMQENVSKHQYYEACLHFSVSKCIQTQVRLPFESITINCLT